MAHEPGMESDLVIETKVDPNKFDVTISALLTGLGAEKYLNIFKKHNIGQCTLMELTEEDLSKLGVDDPEVRRKILSEVQNLPLSQETTISQTNKNLGAMEIVDILEDTSQHLYRIYLSMLANTLAVKKTKNIADSLLHQDKYASDIALVTLNEMTNILNSMDINLHMEMKGITQKSNKKKTKKILIGTLGSAIIAMVAVLFVRSLKQLK